MADSEQQPILQEEPKRSSWLKKILIAVCILVVFVAIGILIAVITTNTFVKDNGSEKGMFCIFRCIIFIYPVDNFGTVVGENPTPYGLLTLGLSMDCQMSTG